ncbi:5,6-dimethylbenzimidazole synthase [Roseixanthobacter liquoris]|uniref:5,6-dimethylbenzimidazole synthase n=1 Tax=Roseixanthobacter liquoris TaxID=3119921 RepID=UPI00372C1F54
MVAHEGTNGGAHPAPHFDAAFRARLHDLLAWRRDVRHFRTDPLPDGTMARLLQMACLSPSVGLSEPWRFVLVDDPARRAAVRACFEACNAHALASQSADKSAAYARLKLAGLDDAPVHFALFADRETAQGHGLGRLTMPETLDYSAVMAVQTLWLAARAEGIGLGWVSILPPDRMGELMDVPAHWRFIGYFCLGFPRAESAVPELETRHWEHRHPPEGFVLRR